MKLGKDVLVEIFYIFHTGLLEQRDVSQMLRDLDIVESDGELVLSEEYLRSRES